MTLKTGWLHEAAQSLGTWLHEADDWQNSLERLNRRKQTNSPQQHSQRDQKDLQDQRMTNLVVGRTSEFAIESSISKAFRRTTARALGNFILHVGGVEYGVRAEDATLLGCSFDEVGRRIAAQGGHQAPFVHASASEVAHAIRAARYDPSSEDKWLLGMYGAQLDELITAHDLLWAPDGDQAFDDGSFVVQMDSSENVRIIAFKSTHGYVVDSGTLRDVTLEAEHFYALLAQWRSQFESQWSASVFEEDLE